MEPRQYLISSLPLTPRLKAMWEVLDLAAIRALAGSTGKKGPFLSLLYSRSCLKFMNFSLLSSRLLIKILPFFISFLMICKLLGRLMTSCLLSTGNRFLVARLYLYLGTESACLKICLLSAWNVVDPIEWIELRLLIIFYGLLLPGLTSSSMVLVTLWVGLCLNSLLSFISLTECFFILF